MQVKTTKREQNNLILSNIFFAIIAFSSLFWWWYYLYWEISNIEEIKANTIELNTKLNSYKKEWIDFTTLGEILSEIDTSSMNDAEKKTLESNKIILKEIDENFYNNNFINKKENNFDSFINKKKEDYKKNNWDTEKKLEIISKILPLYSAEKIDENTLTDFQFINYIESIISTFRLSYKNYIWIKDIKQVENYVLSNTDKSLDKTIWEIPVELDISWRKSSIIDFLHFIEKVWKITVNEESWEITVDREVDELNNPFSEFKTKLLNWQKRTWDYNIFNNQIVDIDNIILPEYIDSSDTEIKNSLEDNRFLKEIKNSQDREKYEIKVKLKFYTKGVPLYKINQFKTDFNNKLKKTTSDITKILSNIKISSSEKQKLQSIKVALDNISSSVLNQNKDSQKWVMESFADIYTYSQLLDDYIIEVENINKRLTNKK